MQVLRRVLGGSAINWIQMVVMAVGQILVVPIYLSHWDPALYGLWLTLQAAIAYVSVFSGGFQQYIFGEFLSVGPLQKRELRAIFWSRLPLSYGVAAVETGAVVALGYSGLLSILFGGYFGAELYDGWIVLVLFCLLNLMMLPFGGAAVNLVTLYGYFQRCALWGLLRGSLVLFLPAIGVLAGADFLEAGLLFVLANAIGAVLSLVDMIRIMRREDVLSREPLEWRSGLKSLGWAQLLTLRVAVENLRQQGVRILLATYLGGSQISLFATTRTLSNVLQMGVGTLINPVLPELMRYVVNRDQKRMESAFAVVWLPVLVGLVPAVLICIAGIAPLFDVWTKGKIAFDPVLFALLCSTALVFAVARPAASVAQGSNLVRLQAASAIASGLALVGLLVVLLPPLGVRGAAMALLVAEAISAGIFTVGAARWLARSGLLWPMASFSWVLAAVGAAVGAGVVIAADDGLAFYVLAVALMLNAVLTFGYFRGAPKEMKAQLSLLLEATIGRAFRQRAG